jgi:amino acid adenylation domain-containing protein
MPHDPRNFPLDSPYDAQFLAAAERFASRLAVSGPDERLTYAELSARAEAWASALSARGVGPESVVALLALRGPTLLAAILGILRAGGSYLPLDPATPAARNARALWLSQSQVMVSLGDNATALRALADEGVTLPLLTEPASNPGTAAYPRAQPRSRAYTVFTSGSTGEPKGVMLEQRGLLNQIWGKVYDLELSEHDVIAQTASHCFDASVWQLLTAPLVGARTAIFPNEIAFQPSALLRSLEEEQVTVAELVPSVLQAMCVAAERQGPRRRPPLRALRFMISTGEPLASALCARWFSLYPDIPLLNAYGPTECSDDATQHRMARAPIGTFAPIGLPTPNVEVHLLDAKLRGVPEGVPGELYIGGFGVGRGYVADPARTAAAFLPHPFSSEPGARLYRTGDLARRGRDGILELLGRTDRQVKVRGLRIELGDLEAALSTHPAVSAARAEVLELASGESSLTAYVTTRGSLEVAALLAHAQRLLPPALVPARFVLLESFPLTPNGKVDRSALARL